MQDTSTLNLEIVVMDRRSVRYVASWALSPVATKKRAVMPTVSNHMSPRNVLLLNDENVLSNARHSKAVRTTVSNLLVA